MMNPIQIAKFANIASMTSRRMLSVKLENSLTKSKTTYNEPLRPVTMDDLVEPYGSWKQAYAAENSRANKALIRGFICLTASLVIFWNSGIVDGLYMPNLDNIMEETESFHVDKEDRISV